MADLANGTLAMPTPQVVPRELTFDDGHSVLDPPTDTKPPVSAARAWQVAAKFGLLAPPDHGAYELLLGNLTSIQNILHRPVWLIIGRNVPTVPLSGGPAPPPGVTSPPRPPCYFGNVVQPVDATTGQSLFVESGSVQVP